MSRAEQYSWLSLAGLAAVFWWFQMRMLDGFTVAEQSAARLFGVYVAVIAASTFLELTIAALVWRGRPPERDERDAAIEARANLAERVAIIDGDVLAGLPVEVTAGRVEWSERPPEQGQRWGGGR